MRHLKLVSILGTGILLAAATASAQTPAFDPSARLREVLPADVAQKVLATIAAARAHELPAQALENNELFQVRSEGSRAEAHRKVHRGSGRPHGKSKGRARRCAGPQAIR